MPLFEFQCVKCKRRVEKIYTSFDAMQKETDCYCDRHAGGPEGCTGFLERVQSAPAFKVNGFNQQTGYAGARTISQRKGGVKTTVSGNFEAFDKLHG